MKSNTEPSRYSTANPLKVLHQDPSVNPAQNRSPYLTAILSGSTKLSYAENDLPLANPDKAAALRYIKESSLLKK